MKRLALVLALVPVGFGVSSGCLPWVEEHSVETLRRPGASELVVRLDRGTLSVREHLGSEIEVEVRRSARGASRDAARAALGALVVEFAALEGGGGLVLTGRVATAGAFRPWEDLGLEVDVGVPAGTALDARTGDGRIELRDLTGPTRATTASGRIVARGLRGPARLRTGDGRIEGDDLAGEVQADTGDGRIRLHGRLRRVRAASGDGRVEVVVTGGDLSGTGDWFLRAADGGVRLTLPAGADASLSAVGPVQTGDEDEVSSWRREGPVALATLGDGSGPRIHLRAGDGSVRVRLAGGR